MVAIDTINSTPQADSLVSVGRIRANFDAMKVAVDAIEDGGYSGFPFERDGSIGSTPTRVQRGLYRTFSFPIWSAGVSEEDLSFALRVPFRWDGTTNPHIYFITAPTANETDGDKYQFQLEVSAGDVGAVIPDTVCQTLTAEVSLDAPGNVAWYGHILDFEVSCATLVAGQNMQMNLTRIAATASEVAAEPAVIHWNTRWYFDKLGTASESGY